ncbi:MAG: ROK family protein [Planctomycetota bacterium]
MASRNERPRVALGIDLGATNLKLGLLRDAKIIAHTKIRTADFEQPADAFRGAREFAKAEMRKAGLDPQSLECVGLAMPGVIDDAGAVLMETANLHAWHGIRFHDELANVFQVPVAVINDANAAALGESIFGRYQVDSLALLTIGTGIGGGLITNGRAVGGKHGCGGEIGHMTIDYSNDARLCGCGKTGHLEAYSGAAGIVQTAKELLAQAHQESSGASLLNSSVDFTPQQIAEAAEDGDAIAKQTVQLTAIYLGRAISMVAHVTDPAVVLLGGAIHFGANETTTGREFLARIRREVADRSLVQVGTQVTIDFATLGNDAGMLGAAEHARRDRLARNG